MIAMDDGQRLVRLPLRDPVRVVQLVEGDGLA
jgi:hypothetical protein